MNKKTERKENLRLIIDTLRLSGPLAQARLKESCSLQASTVSYLVNDLRTCNLVVDIGKEDTQGRVGKPGNTISLNNEKAQFLGVYVEDDCLHAYLIGIDGKTLGYEYVEYAPNDVEKMIFAIIETNLKAHHSIQGIGITIKAIVYNDGRIKSGIRRGSQDGKVSWDLVDLPDNLKEAFPDVPIIIENDANSAAALYRYTQKCDNFVLYILNDIPFGIGCGLMVNGKVYRGFTGAAGEFFVKDLKVRQIYADVDAKVGTADKIIPVILPHILQTAYLLDPERIVLTGSLFRNLSGQELENAYAYFGDVPMMVDIDGGEEQQLNPARGAAMLAIDDYIQRFVEEVAKR